MNSRTDRGAREVTARSDIFSLGSHSGTSWRPGGMAFDGDTDFGDHEKIVRRFSGSGGSGERVIRRSRSYP